MYIHEFTDLSPCFWSTFFPQERCHCFLKDNSVLPDQMFSCHLISFYILYYLYTLSCLLILNCTAFFATVVVVVFLLKKESWNLIFIFYLLKNICCICKCSYVQLTGWKNPVPLSETTSLFVISTIKQILEIN